MSIKRSADPIDSAWPGAISWLRAASRPLWRESFAGAEWLALRFSPVYQGEGVQHGDGAAVVTVPGFLARDASMHELNAWLRRIGYRPYASRIGRNANCPEVLVERLTRTIDRAYNDTGRRVHLVGHSLGGVLARVAAVSSPERVASVTTLAAPVRGPRVHPILLHIASVVLPACFAGLCTCGGLLRELERPLPTSIATLSLYSRNDGVLDWRCCLNDDAGATNIDVRTTHTGMAANVRVYGLLAGFLSRVRDVRLVSSQVTGTDAGRMVA